MAREGRWGRGRAARREAAETAGAVQSADATAARPHQHHPPRPPPTQGWRAREQRAAERRAARAAASSTEPNPDPRPRRTRPSPTPRPDATPTDRRRQLGARAAGVQAGQPDAVPAGPGRAPAPGPDHAVGMTVAAALAGRPSRELLLILGTVLVGQVILGWFNDLVDRKRDARHQRTGKPLADGRLDPGTVWFCLALAVFLVVPLSVANGLLRRVGVPHLPRHRPARPVGLAAQGLPLVAAVGGVVRALPGVPLLRRLGRPGEGRPARAAHHRAGRAARDRRAPADRAVGAGARQRGPLDLPPAQARTEDRRLPAAVGGRHLHRAGAGRRWPSPAPTSGSRRSRSSSRRRVH